MKVYIVHGYTASPEHHWFPWLAGELSKRGIACECLAMPDAHHPTPESWQAYLEKQVQFDAQTVVVGHSLGCIAWLNFFAKIEQMPLAAVFVSGFYQPLHTLPELTPFADCYAKSPLETALNVTVITALDDDIVPHQYSDALSQHLNADYIRLKQGGHFLDREGWTTFPMVLELIEKMFHG